MEDRAMRHANYYEYRASMQGRDERIILSEAEWVRLYKFETHSALSHRALRHPAQTHPIAEITIKKEDIEWRRWQVDAELNKALATYFDVELDNPKRAGETDEPCLQCRIGHSWPGTGLCSDCGGLNDNEGRQGSRDELAKEEQQTEESGQGREGEGKG